MDRGDQGNPLAFRYELEATAEFARVGPQRGFGVVGLSCRVARQNGTLATDIDIVLKDAGGLVGAPAVAALCTVAARTHLSNSNTHYQYCQVRFAQDYCGLSVHSPQTDSDYGGWGLITIHSDGGVELVRSNLVPVLPMPRNVLLDEAEIIGTIIGETLTFYCNREISVVPSEQDVFDVSPSPLVFVRTSPTDAAALEYRLAVRVEVTAQGMPLFVYVDGIDGSLLEVFVNATC